MSEFKNEKYWGKFANDYDNGVDYIVGKEIQEEIIQHLSGEHDLGQVVEFGCGTGYFTKIIAKNANHVTATDLSNEMLNVVKQNLKGFKNITIQKSDCENSAFPSGKFDAVFMANVIHFIKHPHKALRESHRILKDGGTLLLVDYTGHGMKWLDKVGLGMRFVSKCGIPPRYFKTDLTPDEFRAMVTDAGFRIKNIKLIGEKSKALYLKGRKV